MNNTAKASGLATQGVRPATKKTELRSNILQPEESASAGPWSQQVQPGWRNIFVLLSTFRIFETLPLRYYRSGIKIKMIFYFVFRSLNRIFAP